MRFALWIVAGGKISGMRLAGVVSVLFLFVFGQPDLLSSTTALAETPCSDTKINRISPPDAGFYSKQICYKGIRIKAHSVVADQALFEARDRLKLMLAKAPTIATNLATLGNELHLIGRNQVTSDLPELRDLRGKGRSDDPSCPIDACTRGLGGFSASCGEENLLGLPSDTYRGEDICMHEFSHTIHQNALSQKLRDQWTKLYNAALRQGLWGGTYAGTNEFEYFAELTQSYFGVNNFDQRGVNSKAALKNHDPAAFAFLDGLFQGRTQTAPITVVELQPRSCKEADSIKSGGGSTETRILFHNNTVQAMGIYWIDFQGNATAQYGSVVPGGIFAQDTFATHVWMLKNTTGECVAIFVAEDQWGRADIENR